MEQISPNPSLVGGLNSEETRDDVTLVSPSRDSSRQSPRSEGDAEDIIMTYRRHVQFLEEDQEELLAEETRLMGGPNNEVNTCPFCLVPIGDMPPHYRHVCCGAKVCEVCHRKARHQMLNSARSCEFCQETSPTTMESIQLVKTHASKGKLWATHELGVRYLYGMNGFNQNSSRGLEHLNKAASRGYADSQYWLGYELRDKPECEETHYDLIRRASNQGHAQAQYAIAHHFEDFREKHGLELDEEQVQHLSRLSAAKFCPDAMIYSAQEAEKNGLLNHALYWYIQAVNFGSKTCYAKLADVIGKWHESVEMNGPDPIPLLYQLRVYHWKFEREKGPMKKMMTEYSSHCASCGCEVTRKLVCSQCKISHYCSRECQARHWEEGHKKHCQGDWFLTRLMIEKSILRKICK